MIDITDIITIIIRLIVAVVATFAIPWLKAKVSAEKLVKAKNLVKIGVQAAEMIFGAGEGKAKKQYVIDYIITEFNKAELTFDGETINNMIESAVLEMSSNIG